MSSLNIILIFSFAISFGAFYCESVPVGGQCSTDQECDGFPESTVCDDIIGYCLCNALHVPVTGNFTTCEKIRDEIGETCEVSEQCTQGTPGKLSDCIPSPDDPDTKICNCTEGNIHQPGEHVCHEIRSLIGEQCKVDAQCSYHLSEWGECSDDGKCACRVGAVAKNELDKCLPIRNELELECQIPEQCTLGVPGLYSDCMDWFEDDNEEPSGKICNCTEIAINEPGFHECYLRRDELGEECDVSSQCRVNMGDLSECGDSKKCTCTEEKGVPNTGNNICLEIINIIGGECSESQQCQSGVPGEHSICLEGKCACNSGAVNEPGQHKCLEPVDLIGGICQSNMQCKANLGSLSECTEGRCTCTPDYGVGNQHGNFCNPVINFIGGDCIEDIQCKTGVPGEYSDCLPSTILPGSKVCNCSVGAVHQIGRHKCYKVADKIGETCDIAEQCWGKLGELSECVGGDQGCQCVKDEAIGNKNGDKCLAIIDKIGERCEENGQCVSGAPGQLSECGRNDEYPYDNICKCQDAAVKHPSTEECLMKAVNVGDRCAVSLQCTINIGNLTECDNEGFCSCVEGAVGNAEGAVNTKCIPGGILIGNSCYDKAQCVGHMDVSSTCWLGICGCLAGYTESMKLDNCLVIRDHLGDGCEEPQQCQQGNPGEWSECRENACRCTDDAINEEEEHKCYLKAIKVGDSCEKNIQCVANLVQSQCLNGKCVCMQNSTVSENGDKCLSIMNLNEPCEDINQCNHIDHATCQKDGDEKIENGSCQCEWGYMENPGKLNSCMTRAMIIGDTCEEHPNQCNFLVGATCHMDLVPRVCKCNDLEEVVSGDETKCLKAVRNLYEMCNEHVQCQVVNSICGFYELINHTACICGDGYTESSNGRCLPVRYEIGQICEDTKQCAGIGANVECILNACRCTEQFDDYENKCYLPSKIGQKCESNQQCHLGVNKLASCNLSSGRCTCLENTYQLGDLCIAEKMFDDSYTWYKRV